MARAGGGGEGGRAAGTSPPGPPLRPRGEGRGARADRWAKLGRNFNPRANLELEGRRRQQWWRWRVQPRNAGRAGPGR